MDFIKRIANRSLDQRLERIRQIKADGADYYTRNVGFADFSFWAGIVLGFASLIGALITAVAFSINYFEIGLAWSLIIGGVILIGLEILKRKTAFRVFRDKHFYNLASGGYITLMVIVALTSIGMTGTGFVEIARIRMVRTQAQADTIQTIESRSAEQLAKLSFLIADQAKGLEYWDQRKRREELANKAADLADKAAASLGADQAARKGIKVEAKNTFRKELFMGIGLGFLIDLLYLFAFNFKCRFDSVLDAEKGAANAPANVSANGANAPANTSYFNHAANGQNPVTNSVSGVSTNSANAPANANPGRVVVGGFVRQKDDPANTSANVSANASQNHTANTQDSVSNSVSGANASGVEVVMIDDEPFIVHNGKQMKRRDVTTCISAYNGKLKKSNDRLISARDKGDERAISRLQETISRQTKNLIYWNACLKTLENIKNSPGT